MQKQELLTQIHLYWTPAFSRLANLYFRDGGRSKNLGWRLVIWPAIAVLKYAKIDPASAIPVLVNWGHSGRRNLRFETPYFGYTQSKHYICVGSICLAYRTWCRGSIRLYVRLFKVIWMNTDILQWRLMTVVENWSSLTQAMNLI